MPPEDASLAREGRRATGCRRRHPVRVIVIGTAAANLARSFRHPTRPANQGDAPNRSRFQVLFNPPVRWRLKSVQQTGTCPISILSVPTQFRAGDLAPILTRAMTRGVAAQTRSAHPDFRSLRPAIGFWSGPPLDVRPASVDRSKISPGLHRGFGSPMCPVPMSPVLIRLS